MRTDIINNDLYILNRISTCVDGPVIIYISLENSKTKNIYDNVKSTANKEFNFYELIVKEWDDYLTPWPMQMGNRLFGGKADELLSFINSEVICEIKKEGILADKLYLAGYSLAGLFSLWSLYESDMFSGAVSCSGSLWYDGWTEYVRSKELAHEVRVYLSLGDKEKNTKNISMSRVEDNTLLQKEIMDSSSKVSEVHFELNKGGHFADVAERMTKGISWLLKGMAIQYSLRGMDNDDYLCNR